MFDLTICIENCSTGHKVIHTFRDLQRESVKAILDTIARCQTLEHQTIRPACPPLRQRQRDLMVVIPGTVFAQSITTTAVVEAPEERSS